MRREVELIFDTIVTEDRPVTELLTGDYTFVNERLARHYGIPNIQGSQFRRVTLGPDQDVRKGLTGKGAFLVTTAKPERTSPVTRGKWVMTNILGMSPPDPPADVPPLPPRAADPNAKEPSMRQKMMDHRVRPDCVQCHQLMDPIGFALETFDGIGLVRTPRRRHAGGREGAHVRQHADRRAEPACATGWPPTTRSSSWRWPPRSCSPTAWDAAWTIATCRWCARWRATPAQSEQPLLGARARRGEEPAVPDEYALGAAGHDDGVGEHDTEPRKELEGYQSCSSPRSTSAGVRSCRARAPRWRCRCWMRWCPRASCWRRRPPTPRRRFVGIFFPHGMAPGHWEPAAEGALPEKLPYILESLEKVKDQTTVLSGLWSQSAEPPEGRPGSDHWVAAAYLTGIKPRKTAGSDATTGSATIDQMIAQKIGQETLLPSLQLAVEDPELQLEQLRRGLQLLVHELDLVDRPADARRARRCRAPARCRWS